VQARFEAPDAALSETIEDRLWAIRDENTEFVTRAMEAGMRTLRIDGWNKVKAGETTIEEVLRVTQIEEHVESLIEGERT